MQNKIVFHVDNININTKPCQRMIKCYIRFSNIIQNGCMDPVACWCQDTLSICNASPSKNAEKMVASLPKNAIMGPIRRGYTCRSIAEKGRRTKIVKKHKTQRSVLFWTHYARRQLSRGRRWDETDFLAGNVRIAEDRNIDCQCKLLEEECGNKSTKLRDNVL